MTADKMNQLRDLGKEIELLRREIILIRRGHPIQHNIPVRAYTAYDLKLLESKLKRQMEKAKETERELLDFIEGVDDSMTRQAFYYRYVKGKTWSGVAAALGGVNSEENLRKMTVRYLKKYNEREKQ